MTRKATRSTNTHEPARSLDELQQIKDAFEEPRPDLRLLETQRKGGAVWRSRAELERRAEAQQR